MTMTVQPLYVRCSREQALTTWIGAGLNALLVVWSAVWLFDARATSPSWPVLAAVVFAGMFLADLFTGVIHWMTDTWFDEIAMTRVISIAREHHLYPHHILGYGFRDYVGYTSWPAVVAFGPFLVWLLIGAPSSATAFGTVLLLSEICLLCFFGTHFHRFGHRRARNPVVRALQRAHLLITPEYHARHHGGGHDTHYCVVNGWANVVCDAIGFWRGLEVVARRLTRAVPRYNDAEWFARFRQDRSFVTDPVPSLRQWRGEDLAAHERPSKGVV